MSSYDLLIRGGNVINHLGRWQGDIAIADGRFVAMGNLKNAAAKQVFDAHGLTVLPGIIDTQVHMREPGNEHKEDLHTGSMGAALGGVVGVFEMPNTKPSTTTPEALQDKLNRANGRMFVDHAFYVGGSAENAEQLGALERLPGCCGVKVFMGSSTGNLLVSDDETLEKIIRHINRRMAVHCEDEPRLIERRALIPAQGATAHLHPVWRDEETALRATTRLVNLARKYGKRIHVLHITTAEEMAFLRQHKDVASVEVLANHLTLAAPDCYDRLGTYAQMNPPIRGERHRSALWDAVSDGTVDIVATDHAPHTRAEKNKPYPETPSGMPGVQTLVGILLDHVHHGRLTLERLIDLTSAGPQRLFGLARKGRIACGYDADLTVVDLQAKHTITDAEMANRSGWTPFNGMTVTGWPEATIVRGNIVMRDGQLIGQPQGKPIQFMDCLPSA
jgi:dihydroorotase